MGGQPQRSGIPHDTFAARLMLARLHAGNLTIQDAAEKCGLINQSWSNWERGMKPRDLLDVVQAISGGLGIDQNWLLFGGPLTPEKRHRDVRRRNRLSYPRPARRTPKPISRGGALAVRGQASTFGSRSSVRRIDNRPPSHPRSALRWAA